MYKGMWDVLAKAVEKEGVKGLYKVDFLPRPDIHSTCKSLAA